MLVVSMWFMVHTEFFPPYAHASTLAVCQLVRPSRNNAKKGNTCHAFQFLPTLRNASHISTSRVICKISFPSDRVLLHAHAL